MPEPIHRKRGGSVEEMRRRKTKITGGGWLNPIQHGRPGAGDPTLILKEAVEALRIGGKMESAGSSGRADGGRTPDLCPECIKYYEVGLNLDGGGRQAQPHKKKEVQTPRFSLLRPQKRSQISSQQQALPDYIFPADEKRGGPAHSPSPFIPARRPGSVVVGCLLSCARRSCPRPPDLFILLFFSKTGTRRPLPSSDHDLT